MSAASHSAKSPKIGGGIEGFRMSREKESVEAARRPVSVDQVDDEQEEHDHGGLAQPEVAGQGVTRPATRLSVQS